MLKIRTEQLLAFKEAALDDVHREIAQRLRERFPAETEAMPPAVLQAIVRRGMQRAPDYEIYDAVEAEELCGFMVRLGADFDTRLKWARNILNQGFKSGADKLAELEFHAKGR